jgi:hypothetical protein
MGEAMDSVGVSGILAVGTKLILSEFWALILGGFGTVSDTPKPTDTRRPIAEFRTPRDGRRRTVRAIGNELRVLYTDFLRERLPPKITDLLRRLDGGRKR